MVSKPVGLDHEAECRPVEVDAVPLPSDLGFRERQAAGANDPQEAPLELGVGQAKGVAVEEGT